jgi:lipopolysaccharide export system protein LptA
MPLLPANRLALFSGAALLAIALPVLAERGDRDKPVNLESDTVEINDLTKVSVYQGNVRLTQGTMLITGNKLVVVQDDNGLSKGTSYGNPTYFRQKREGVDELIEGWAQRIEYDAKTDKIEMHTQARIKRGADEVHGNLIVYEGQTESYRVLGGKESASEYNPKGRVRAVIQPKRPTSAPKTGDGLPLQPSPGVNNPN